MFLGFPPGYSRVSLRLDQPAVWSVWAWPRTPRGKPIAWRTEPALIGEGGVFPGQQGRHLADQERWNQGPGSFWRQNVPHPRGTVGIRPAPTASPMGASGDVWGLLQLPDLGAHPTLNDPPQGAGACFRDTDVSARSPECVQAAGWEPRTPMMVSPRPVTPTSGSHSSPPPLPLVVAVGTDTLWNCVRAPARPRAPLVEFTKGRSRGSARGSSPQKPVLLRTLVIRHRAGPRCSVGPTGGTAA